MTTEERPENTDEDLTVLTPTGQELATVEVREPSPPKGLEEHETAALKSRALALVTELGEASGSRGVGADGQHHKPWSASPTGCWG